MGTKKGALPARDEIDEKYKWKIEDIYAKDEDWEEDFKEVKALKERVAAYRGRLSESGKTLLECLKLYEDLMRKNDKIFVYAKMKRDEDNSNSRYQSMTDRAMALSTEAYAAVSL